MAAPKKSDKSFGADAVAQMLSHLDEPTRERLLGVLASKDPAAFKKVRERMFTFEEITKLTEGEMRALIEQVPQEKIALALRKASSEVKNAFFKNMSKTGIELLQSKMEEMGPQKLSLVEWAQSEIMIAVKSLKKP